MLQFRLLERFRLTQAILDGYGRKHTSFLWEFL